MQIEGALVEFDTFPKYSFQEARSGDDARLLHKVVSMYELLIEDKHFLE